MEQLLGGELGILEEGREEDAGAEGMSTKSYGGEAGTVWLEE